jgi:hypothetical protein
MGSKLLHFVVGLMNMVNAARVLAQSEDALRASYKPYSLISSHDIEVAKTSVHYLAAGPNPATSSKVVIMCHGAAFTSETWRIVGILDELGAQVGLDHFNQNMNVRSETDKNRVSVKPTENNLDLLIDRVSHR